MKKRGIDQPCPRCGAMDETEDHVLTCKDVESVEGMSAAILALDKALRKAATAPEIRTALVDSVACFVGGRRSILVYRSTDIWAARKEQDRFGGRATIMGFLTTAWLPIQEAFDRKRESKREATTWMATAIAALWEVFVAAWKNRNRWLHDEKEARVRVTREEEVTARIRMVHDRGRTGLPREDEAIFRFTPQKMAKWTLQRREQWVDLAGVILDRMDRRNSTSANSANSETSDSDSDNFSIFDSDLDMDE